MSAIKRRQVIKDNKQTQIAFPHSKANFEVFSLKGDPSSCQSRGNDQRTTITEDMNRQMLPPQMIPAKQQENSTPYRSVNRIKNLLGATPSTQLFLNRVGIIKDSNTSKPSSATTACTTYMPNEMTCYSSAEEEKTGAKKKRDSKKDKKNLPTQKGLVGQKRSGNSQMQLDQMEYFTRLTSKNAKQIIQNLKLRDKKTGKVYDFPLYNEGEQGELKLNPVVTNFDMSKLEVEYDYDTDSEQLTHSKKMLLRDLFQAIEYFIKEDPIKLVENVLL